MRYVAAITAVALVLAVTATAGATTVTWQGVEWTELGSGTAVVDGSNHLVLTPGGSAAFSAWVNRLPTVVGGASSINAYDTPWIKVSWIDTGIDAHLIDMVIQDETATGGPLCDVGSKWTATVVAHAQYNGGVGEDYAFFSSYPSYVSDRTNNLEHTAIVGKTADGTLYFGIDGTWASLTNLVGSWDFNDVQLRIRGDTNATPIKFTDFQFGDNFVPVPEPLTMAGLMLGIGSLVGYVRRRRVA